MVVVRPLLVAALIGAAAGTPPMAGDALLDLASAGGAAAWSAESSSGTLLPSVRVPGDVISALSESGVIADPWLDLTWRQEAGRWDLATWSFAAAFASPAWAAAGSTLLVLDSVKMAADVALNGQVLGAATSQHLRYSWDVSALLQPPGGGDNELNVTFLPTVADTRNDDGRFQGCSGGWCVLAAGRRAHGAAAREQQLLAPCIWARGQAAKGLDVRWPGRTREGVPHHLFVAARRPRPSFTSPLFQGLGRLFQ